MRQVQSYDFVYVHTDIPEGVPIREWRRERAAERERVRARELAGRRARMRARVDAVLVAFENALAFTRAQERPFTGTARAAVTERVPR